MLVPAFAFHQCVAVVPHRAGRDIRPGALCSHVPDSERGCGKGEQHAVRAVRRRLDGQGLAHPLDGGAHARRRRVGEHVQPLRPDFAFRRLQGIWLRPRGRRARPPSVRGPELMDVRKTYKLFVNGVAGPYFNFTIPEPTGVVAVVAPEETPLSGFVRRLAPALCGGNVVVALAAESHPLAALTLAEVLATSDVPAGVINIISGSRKELLPWLANHMDINAIDTAGCTPEEIKGIEEAAAGNVKRVIKVTQDEQSPYLVA